MSVKEEIESDDYIGVERDSENQHDTDDEQEIKIEVRVEAKHVFITKDSHQIKLFNPIRWQCDPVLSEIRVRIVKNPIRSVSNTIFVFLDHASGDRVACFDVCQFHRAGIIGLHLTLSRQQRLRIVTGQSKRRYTF